MHRAGLPAKLPPAVNIDELAGPDPLPSSFDKPLRDPYFDDKLSKDPLDLDPLPSDSPPQLHDNDAHNATTTTTTTTRCSLGSLSE